MLTGTIAAWLASQGMSLLLGFVAKLISDWYNTQQANKAQRDAGRAEVTAAVNARTAETVDAMANVPRPDDAAITDKLSTGKF